MFEFALVHLRVIAPGCAKCSCMVVGVDSVVLIAVVGIFLKKTKFSYYSPKFLLKLGS